MAQWLRALPALSEVLVESTSCPFRAPRLGPLYPYDRSQPPVTPDALLWTTQAPGMHMLQIQHANSVNLKKKKNYC